MKIWIDLTNSPHINFFKPFKEVWEKEGHEVLITTRNLSNTIDLVEQNKWTHTLISGHAGKNRFLKILYFIERVFRLWVFLRKKKVDVGISHSSFYSPLVGKMIGCPTIYLNDNEHAKGNYLAFPFATVNILPEFLEKNFRDNWLTQFFDFKYYKGIKEGIYLSQCNFPTKKNLLNSEKPNIYVRLEPDSADYYSGNTRFLNELLVNLSILNKVVILPRNERQSLRFKGSEFSTIEVAYSPLSLEDIYQNCDLFIGAGGSMSRELAFLNISTLSIYQDDLLEVDKFLVAKNIMYHNPEPTLDYIESLILNKDRNFDNELIYKGRSAFNLIMHTVESFDHHGNKNEPCK